MTQKITPFLWFDGQAEAAANYYVALFKGGKINKVFRWQEDSPHGTAKKGDVLTVDFEIEGMRFSAINGGPNFKLTPAVSFLIEVQEPGRARRSLGSGSSRTAASRWPAAGSPTSSA